MRWLCVDQRAVRDQCEAILARAALAEDRAHQAHGELTQQALIAVLSQARLVPGARARTTAWLFAQGSDPAKQRRTIVRAIPLRGALRLGRVALAAVLLCAALVGLAWLSPRLLVLPPLVAVALLWDVGRRWLHDGRAAMHVHRMEQRARLAEAIGDMATVAALYEEARAMIAEDRIPPGIGFRVPAVLVTARNLTPFPLDLLRDLYQLLVIAPETDVAYDAAFEMIKRGFEFRVHQLASRIHRAVGAAADIEPLLAECAPLIERLPPRCSSICRPPSKRSPTPRPNRRRRSGPAFCAIAWPSVAVKPLLDAASRVARLTASLRRAARDDSCRVGRALTRSTRQLVRAAYGPSLDPGGGEGGPPPEPRVDERMGRDAVSREVAALTSMTSRELAARYEQLVGTPSRSHNPEFLMRQVAVVLQVRRDGWLSSDAKVKIKQLGGTAWSPAGFGDADLDRGAPSVVERDPRLPPVGSVLRRVHAGRTHAVTVLADGFEIRGTRYATLSEVARAITGSKWNGYAFFARALAASLDEQLDRDVGGADVG